MVIAHCTGWWPAWSLCWLVQYIWRLEGRGRSRRWLLPKQPRGHHTRLSLLDCSSIFVFAFVFALTFFLAFGSATLVVLRFCNSHTPLLSFSLKELLFHFSSIKLGSSQHKLCLKGNDDDRAYDNQGGIEGTGHTRYMGPPLTPGPHWSALRNTTASCASNCNRLL